MVVAAPADTPPLMRLHGALPVLRSEDTVDEFLHFPAAFTDQTDDDHISTGIAGHHAQQHALAHTAAGKQADALAASDGQQAVDGAYANIQ